MRKNLIIFGIIFFVILTLSYSKIDNPKVLSTSAVSVPNNIYFDNLKVLSKDTGSALLVNDNINYDINFSNPGDQFSFSFDVVNPTSNNMYVRKMKITGTDDIPFISYSIKDMNGIDIKNNDIIKKNSINKVVITISYDDVNNDVLPTNDYVVDLGLEINFSM